MDYAALMASHANNMNMAYNPFYGSNPEALQNEAFENLLPQPGQAGSMAYGSAESPPRNTDTPEVSRAFFDNASAPRVTTDIFIYDTIRKAHPNPDIEILDVAAISFDLFNYISRTQSGTVVDLSKDETVQIPSVFATNPPSPYLTSPGPSQPQTLTWTTYVHPLRRLDGTVGVLVSRPVFTIHLLSYSNAQFLIYTVSDRDPGTYPNPDLRQYILYTPSSAPTLTTLLRSAGSYLNTLHSEIYVFNQGFWQKDAALYKSIQKSRWEDIILPSALKTDLLATILRFFSSRDVYDKLRVPWKRGIIFHGPPGNGKTISIKATMKTLYDLPSPIPTLYVKTLTSFGGPEYAVQQIFNKARQQAPCYLIFEDLDSLVTDQVRSFFLNAVDGLSENEGILMVGSTNHLDRLDPGIRNRPSRFDRKYEFPDPDETGRERYAEFWRRKVTGEKGGESEEDGNSGKGDGEVKVEFPQAICPAFAKRTDGFSFAYMQEAFVSALLSIANMHDGDKDKDKDKEVDELEVEDEFEVIEQNMKGLQVQEDKKKKKHHKDGDDKELEKYVLWRELKREIKNLREELNEKNVVS